MNINKWIYFTLRIQAQINIREYEIADMFAEEHEEMLDQQLMMQQQTPTTDRNTSTSKHESKPVSFMAVADITEVQLQLLRKRKYAMHVIIGVMAGGFVSIYCYFYGKVCNNQSYYTSSE